jgi:hypothetical protein
MKFLESYMGKNQLREALSSIYLIRKTLATPTPVGMSTAMLIAAPVMKTGIIL